MLCVRDRKFRTSIKVFPTAIINATPVLSVALLLYINSNKQISLNIYFSTASLVSCKISHVAARKKIFCFLLIINVLMGKNIPFLSLLCPMRILILLRCSRYCERRGSSSYGGYCRQGDNIAVSEGLVYLFPVKQRATGSARRGVMRD